MAICHSTYLSWSAQWRGHVIRGGPAFFSRSKLMLLPPIFPYIWAPKRSDCGVRELLPRRMEGQYTKTEYKKCGSFPYCSCLLMLCVNFVHFVTCHPCYWSFSDILVPSIMVVLLSVMYQFCQYSIRKISRLCLVCYKSVSHVCFILCSW